MLRVKYDFVAWPGILAIFYYCLCRGMIKCPVYNFWNSGRVRAGVLSVFENIVVYVTCEIRFLNIVDLGGFSFDY